jgi:serine/threonine protein phosphatase PrpC
LAELLTIEYFGASDIGLVRSENQDSFGKFPVESDDLNNPKGLLFIVADGMGGHTGGKEASQSAVDIISQEYFSFESDVISVCLRYAFKSANFKIHQSSTGDIEYQKKGTTSTALVLCRDSAYIAHVGDSRLYKVTNDKIEQITNDHTHVEEMLRKGILSKEEAENHPSKSVLVRALGIEPDVEVDIIEKIPVKSGETFILCSDGLAKVNKEEIKEIASGNSPADICNELIRMANDRGGKDNVTVQVIKLNKAVNQPAYTEQKSKPARKWFKPVIILGLLAGILLAGIALRENIKNLFVPLNPSATSTDINNKTSNDDELEKLLDKANRFLEAGDYDNAFIHYNLILTNYPMHMEALNGAGLVAAEYFKKGNTLMQQKNYSDALVFLKKAGTVKPDDHKLQSLIMLCEQEIQKAALQKKTDNLTDKPKTEEKVKNVTEDLSTSTSPDKPGLYKGSFSEWSFDNLTERDYSLSENSIAFLKTGKTKKIILQQVMEDIDVSVNLKLTSGKTNNRAGIIIGYNNSEGNSESFFLFSTDESGNFLLQKYAAGSIKRLLFVERPVESKSNHIFFNMKIKSLGPWIMIYNNDKLLDSWLDEDFIKGKPGLFADGNSDAEFSDFRVSPAMESK